MECEGIPLQSYSNRDIETMPRLSLTLLVAALAIAGCGKQEAPTDQQAPASVPAAAQPGQPRQVTTKTGAAMVLLPAGEFLMGDAAGEDDEKPAHKVRLRAFYMDVHEVTQASYEKLMGANPAKHKAPERPVEQVGWLAAIKYSNMRSRREGLTPCYDVKTLACDFAADGYRLPTEAEWEHACRAGGTTQYSFGDSSRTLGRYAWFKAIAGKTTHPVRSKQSNAWGLYDMHGNVWEWCHDRYGEEYYAQSEPTDPRGPPVGDERVLRGGGWNSGPESCRSAARYSETPGFADVCFGYDAYGFRCVRRAPEPAD